MDGATVRGVVIRLRVTGATQDVRIAVAETLQKRQFLAREILAIVLLPQFVLLACTGLLVWSGVTAGLTSLRRVSRDLEGKDHRDLAPVVMEDVPQEIRPIIDRLNELLNRVASMLRHQRNFIADAAHQIRTPLAAVKLQVESLARDDPPARLKPQIEALGRATDRAVHLSQQLLTLARAEPAHNPRDAFIDVELAEIVRASAGPLLPRALQAGMTAEFIASPEHIVMRGDPILLGELVSNLVDNAIRYGRGGTTIIVRLTASPTVTLAVEDDGPGIPLDAIDRVFDRFFRSDQSTPGGTGLGLSIVKEIAETHSAVASIRTRPQFPGTCVVVSFAQSQARSMSDIPIAGLV